MEETKFVRVTHEGEAHFVALYTGLNPAEVSGLLQAAFKLPQQVVGLIDRANSAEPEHEHGVVVPLSLACRAPQVLGDRSYSLLLSDKEVVWERPKSSNMRPTPAQGFPTGVTLEGDRDIFSAGNGDGHTVPGAALPVGAVRAGAGGGRQPAGRTLWGEEGDDDEEQGEEEEEEEVEDEEGGGGDTGRIVAFIRRMAFNGLLTKDDQNALESSAVAGDVVINAAFAVALHSQDLDYLSALFKDIASNRRDSPQGVRLLEAKREMLDMAEVLQQADEVDDEQLVYLQNLILVSNEAVTDAFGVYEEDQDPVRLAESLKQLCGAEARSHTRMGAVAIASTDDDDGEEDDGDDDDAMDTEAERSAMKETVLEVVINLTNKGLLGAREANMANDMVLRENPVLVAAFKLFQEDGNAAELYDTVARAARFEAKRVMGASPATRGELVNADAATSPSSRLTLAPRVNAAVVTAAGGAAKTRVGGDRGLKGREHESSATTSEPSGIAAEGGGVSEGVGEAATLAGFQRLVTVAVQKGMMGMSDAMVICSAFESGLGGESGRLQDLVHAAWGVYSTGGGEDDALDSLVRIVRLAVRPFQPAKVPPVNVRAFLPLAGTGAASGASDRGAAASTTDDLRESMSAAVNAIATQSAHILLQNNKVSAEEASCLASPSPSGCQAILKALEVFEGGSNRDVLLDAFAATAKAEFAKAQMAKRQESAPEQEHEEEDEDNGQDDGQDDDEEHPDGQDGAGGGEDTEEGFSSDRATVELMELVDCMAGDKRIGIEEALRLTELIENRHPGVMLAYTDYAATQDVSALVSSLTAIVRTQGADASAPGMAVMKDTADNDGDGTGDPGTGEKQHGRERVVLLMHETRVLTASDATRLLLLLAREDPNTLAAFQVFDSSKDVSSLVETIKTILQEAPPIAPADLNVAMHKDGGGRFNSSPLLRQILQPLPDATDATTAEDTERGTRIEVNAARTRVDEDEDEDGGGDGSGGIDSPNDDAVAENVVSIVEGMGLDESEAAALRLAIARGDPNIRGALELFRLDPDATELKDTIARVARLVLEREREAGLAERVPEASGLVAGDTSENGSTVAAANNSAAAAAAPADEEGARSIDFTLDDKTGLFQELLQQLGCVGVISEAQAVVIMDRYRNKDAVVFAALDVYKNENDMSELVDTLKRLT